jgi:hypothetical protein
MRFRNERDRRGHERRNRAPAAWRQELTTATVANDRVGDRRSATGCKRRLIASWLLERDDQQEQARRGGWLLQTPIAEVARQHKSSYAQLRITAPMRCVRLW